MRSGGSGGSPLLCGWILVPLLLLLLLVSLPAQAAAAGDRNDVGERSTVRTTLRPLVVLAAGGGKTNSGRKLRTKNAGTLPSLFATTIVAEKPSWTTPSKSTTAATGAAVLRSPLVVHGRGGGAPSLHNSKLANFRQRLLPSIVLVLFTTVAAVSMTITAIAVPIAAGGHAAIAAGVSIGCFEG